MKRENAYDRYLESVYGIKGGEGRTPSDIASYASYAAYCLAGLMLLGLIYLLEVLL